MDPHTPIPIDITRLDNETFLSMLKLIQDHPERGGIFSRADRGAILDEAWERGMVRVDADILVSWGWSVCDSEMQRKSLVPPTSPGSAASEEK